MALGANTKRAMNVAMAKHGAGAEVATALDANTLKTSYVSTHQTWQNAVIATAAEVNKVADVTAGAVAASKALVVGATKNAGPLKLNNANYVESEATETLAEATTDAYAGGVTLDGGYAGSDLTHHNYINLETPSTSGMNITTSCVFRFDAALGTHPATGTDTSAALTGCIYVNANGTVKKLLVYDA